MYLCIFAMISNIERFAEFKDSFVGINASLSSLTCDGGNSPVSNIVMP